MDQIFSKIKKEYWLFLGVEPEDGGT